MTSTSVDRTNTVASSVSQDRFKGVSSGLAMKAPVRAATTANITLSGLQTIDGVALAAGDRVLVKDQTNPVNNGIYVASTSSWERDIDANGTFDLVTGTLVKVTAGSANGANIGELTTTGTIVVGTTALTWVMRSGTLAGGALLLTGGLMIGAMGEAMGAITASATPDIFALAVGNTINLTTGATITGFVAAPQAGMKKTLIIGTGTQAFTAGANLLIDNVASGTDYTASEGDRLDVIALTTTQFRINTLRGGSLFPDVAAFAAAQG